jgi:glycosyltransferase involved in cell wall biosynthesis
VSLPRIVCAVETWNEAGFLPRWLGHVETFAAAVVAIDDGSSDDSAAVLRAHPKVNQVLAKPRGKRHEVKDRRILTRMALDEKADWICFLDADEVFDARVDEALPRLLEAAEASGAGEVRFRKFTLWRGEDQLRLDRPDKFSAWSPCRLVKASPDLRWRYPAGTDLHRYGAALLRRRRLLPQYGHREIANVPGPVMEVGPEELVIVYYSSTDYAEMVHKQIRYAVGELQATPRRDPDEITDWAFRNLDESTLELGPVPDEWKPLP